jgi:hypothetical protein
VKQFKQSLRQYQLRAIRECFDAFNEKGGAVVPLQNGEVVYFARAAVLAIYADHPAAVKCTQTGSACPQCYTIKPDMPHPPDENGMILRTDANMASRKRALQEVIRLGNNRQRKKAKNRAHRQGVALHGRNAWVVDPEHPGKWIFGPSPTQDSLFQAIPQVNLHGLDEGTTSKLAIGTLELAISCSTLSKAEVKCALQMYFHNVFSKYSESAFVIYLHKVLLQCTFIVQVCRRIDRLVMDVANQHTLNSNVEIKERSGFKLFPHGVTDYLLKKRCIDGGWYISILRHLHVVLCTGTTFFCHTSGRR